MEVSWKRFLSMLLAAAMVLSFGGAGYAAELDEDIVIVDPEEAADVQLVDEIQAAAEGKVWVGGVEVTEDNASDVLGDGKVSYDFESNALSFTAKPSFSGVHEGALIYAATETPLTINMPAKSFYLMSGEAEVCIYTENGLIVNGDLNLDFYDNEGGFGVKSMNGPVTINGNADIAAKETGIYCGNGDVMITGTGYFAGDSEATLGFCPSSFIYTANGGVDIQNFAVVFGVAAYAIYAHGPVHIGSDLDLDNSGGLGGGDGILSTAGGIVIDGYAKINLRGGVCLDARDAAEGVVVNGYADLKNTGDINVLKALGGPIFIDGYLKVNGRGDCVVQAKGDITVNGYAYISASRYNSSDPASAMRSTDGSINIAGSLTTYSSDSPVYAKKDITVGSDMLLSFARATESKTVEFGLKAETGAIHVNGKLEVLGKADCSVCAGTDITVEKDVTITNAAENAVGMLAGGKISFVDGKWDVSAGAAALRAKNGIEIPEGFCVTTPVCGTVSKVGDYDTVTEFDGSTVAAHAVIEAGSHEWSEPSYVWAEDNSSVTATRVCKNNEEHTETETVETTSEVTVRPSCEDEGEMTYTALFENPAFETQTRTVVIPAAGHDWGEPVYVWTETEDGFTVTATMTCANDAAHDHEITETTAAVYEVITEPTTTAEGLGRWTATFTNEAFEPQTKDVVIEKLPVEGFRISIEDFTKAKATVTGIEAGSLYSGEVSFTVSSADDMAVLFVVKEVGEDGTETYTRLVCSTDETSGEHSFTITVDKDTTIALAFKGDVNLDGAVKSSDATMIKRTIAGTYEITKALGRLTADVNSDGEVKSSDATMLSRSIASTYVIKW
ncbi:MAG: dockerin type I repeat-containing protein [Oscillospiraceae bacterium]|nr:dockerin type I repeat-containing protein [Oscillospiraceae bacterium]